MVNRIEMIPSMFIHGGKGTPEYGVWKDMKRRCYAKNRRHYRWYGAKGIRVCARWLHDFSAFLDDMGARPADCTDIDRIDSSGNYCPENCRWVDKITQAQNRSNNRLITHKGQTRTMSAWRILLGISQGALHNRLDRSCMSIDEAFTKPVRISKGIYKQLNIIA